MKNILVIFCLSILFISCKSVGEKQSVSRGVVSEHAMVVSARKEASLIGLEILKKGVMRLMQWLPQSYRLLFLTHLQEI